MSKKVKKSPKNPKKPVKALVTLRLIIRNLTNYFLLSYGKKKSCKRETKHLLLVADSNTDTIIWWTKNTPERNLKQKKLKKSLKTQKLKNI